MNCEFQASRHFHLAELAASAWLTASLIPGKYNVLHIRQEIDALRADICMIKAHLWDMKDPDTIQRANQTIERLFGKIFAHQELLRSLRLAA
tara:strand:+ start:9877 stop:10152 length:276 start_codon:yes stop_codon:yes gene_type:complete